MNALTFSDDLRGIARTLELRRSNGRAGLARELGCAPGTLENLQRDRLKDVKKSWLKNKIECLLIREIEAEIRRLTHELEKHRLSGRDLGEAPLMARLLTTMEAAERLIGTRSARQ